jgi:hypothetical protein
MDRQGSKSDQAGMKIVITGATGLIGRRLCGRLQQAGHRLVVLTRRVASVKTTAQQTAFAWQPEQEPPPIAAFDSADAVIHLAGEPVAARWTDESKRRIRDSRVKGTRHLVQTMQRLPQPPRVFISGSAVGFYGPRGDEVLDESAAAGQGFLSDVCVAWEQAARQAESFGTRVTWLRIGVVLDPDGGALKTMLPAFKLGIAGKLASGRQWFPWIHRADITGLLEHALTHDAVRGPLNAVAPNPVTNEEFTKELAAVLNRPALIPVPKFALDLLFGEMASATLASQRVAPHAALDTGYAFQFPWLRAALEDLFRS